MCWIVVGELEEIRMKAFLISHLHNENLPRKRNEMLAQLSAKLSSNMVDGKEYLMRMC